MRDNFHKSDILADGETTCHYSELHQLMVESVPMSFNKEDEEKDFLEAFDKFWKESDFVDLNLYGERNQKDFFQRVKDSGLHLYLIWGFLKDSELHKCLVLDSLD